MRYLLFLSKNYSFSILKPLYDIILKRQVGDVFWFSTQQERFNTNPNSWLKNNADVLDYSPDVIFAPGNVIPYHWPGLKVQIFHGLGEEKKGHYRLNGLFDMYCTPGPYITEKFTRLNKNKQFIIVETGWSKLDSLDIQNRIGSQIFRNDFQTILYAPTFSNKLTSAYDLFDTIKRLQKFNYNWIIKFHELMDKSLIQNYTNLKSKKLSIITAPDILPLMSESNILLTDTSSVAYEYLLFNKPIITYNAKTRIDKGINILSPSELEGALIRTITNPDEYKENREYYLSELHPYLDGNSSARVLDAVSQVIKNGQKQSTKLNLLYFYNRWKTRNWVS